MAEAIDLGQFTVSHKSGRREQVQRLTTALLMAKAIKEATGSTKEFEDAMERILQDPETVGSCLIMTVNLFYGAAGPHKWAELCGYLMNEVMD